MADAVTDANDVLLEVIRRAGGAPGPIARGAAMMHGAIYDAVSSIAPATHRPYLVSVPAPPGASVDAAVAHAAHATLVDAFKQPAAVAYLATVAPAADATGGEAVGRAAAQAMIDARTGDGSTDNAPYIHSTAAGCWRPTGSGAAASPNWPSVKPFCMPHGSAFRPPLCGGYASKEEMLQSGEYAAQLAEVRELGEDDSGVRTPEQTEIAFFWANDLDGTYKPPGQLFDITKKVSVQKGLTLTENARLFALVAFAMADAGICAWDAKYDTRLDLWRPETAIREDPIDADEGWEPLSQNPATHQRFSPPFPAYVSGHATFGAAHAAVMRRYFGTDNVTFTATTEDPNLVGPTPRTFNSFTAAALENARSRVYLGVHFQWDGDHGFQSGTALGEYVYDHVLTPVGA
jgi:hypothetical protein